jgi:hypothetical protein
MSELAMSQTATLSIALVASRAQLRTFIALPRVLYAGMAGFVAPLDQERRELLDPRKAAFYAHGVAAYWLAMRDGRVVGRVSAQVDRAGDVTAGLFGCLDAIDDAAVVRALLETAEGWLRAMGCVSATGPYMLSINGESGLLLEGHAEPPMVLMPWHPPYLPALVAAAGYGEARRLESFSLDLPGFDGDAKFAAYAEGNAAAGITIRALRLNALAEEAEIARALFNDAWVDNWGFVPLQAADMTAMVKGFRPVLFKECASVAEIDGTAVGLALVVPNIAELNADLGGRPSLLGWLKIAWRVFRPRYHGARMILFGLKRDYRASLTGLAVIMKIVAAMIAAGRRLGLTTIEAGWVLDNNHQVLRMLRSVGFRRSRVYGIYAKALV